MRSRSIRFILLLSALILFISGCASSTDSGGTSNAGDQGNQGQAENNDQQKENIEPIKLSIAHAFPGAHPIETEIIQPWAKAIEEKTDGLITVESYPVGTLLAADQIYDGVVNGAVDMGLSFFSYTPGRFPVMASIELPGIPINNAMVGTRIAMDILNEFNPEEVQDTKIMLTGTTGTAYLITKDPVRKLEDLKGMQIRTTGGSAGGIEALGGSPVSMPMSDAYDAMSKGVVDGVLGATEIVRAYKLNEVANYVTVTPFLYNGNYFLNINKDKWESIPADLQQVIEAESQKLHEDIIPNYFDEANAAGLQYGIDESGIEVITLSDEEIQKWIDVLSSYNEKYAQDLDAQGLPGTEVLEKIKSLAEEYNEQFK
jgi:TRAP-type C4-dicarboxylate transport system substrate-binding protein